MKDILIWSALSALGCINSYKFSTGDTYAYPESFPEEHITITDYTNKCNFPESLYQTLHKEGIASELINKFENHSKVNCSTLKSKDIILVDYTMSINEKRFFVISYTENKVKYKGMVSHAFNTGDDYAESFSNVPNSNYSSKGLFKIHERVVRSILPYSFPVSGLDSENNNAYKRNITIHRSLFDDNDYVGHSYGCFALTPAGIKKIKEFNIANSYLYAYYES